MLSFLLFIEKLVRVLVAARWGYRAMRISNNLLKTVGFVCPYEPDGAGGSFINPRGTAFLVDVEMEKNAGFKHIVTAKHVAKAIEETEGVIAMNGKDGEPLFFRTGKKRWFYHPPKRTRWTSQSFRS
jgi:hypothetical protein